MPALEYPLRRMPPGLLRSLLKDCTGRVQHWYLVECSVSSITVADEEDDDVLGRLEQYYETLETCPTEIDRAEVDRLLDSHVEFENLCLAASRKALDLESMTLAKLYRDASLIVEYRDTEYCFVYASDAAGLRCYEQLAPDFKRVSETEWPFGPW